LYSALIKEEVEGKMMNHFAIMAIEKQQQQAKVSNHHWTENPCELCSTNFHIIVTYVLLIAKKHV